MAGVGQQLFPGAGFTGDQQRRIDQRHARGTAFELQHFSRLAQDIVKATRIEVLHGA